ncbi:hypothetical protein B0H66DRAFT_345196 [Apodospora peruviana]|uniref:Uncharacterized protein n=1 Tax=Apodospora peruviana TaxID=516989 RepID=A0AAE0HZ43_9PEZI|nr:hypothetical protein B0H66DRAFT_345196 [Apodospora peruviana]
MNFFSRTTRDVARNNWHRELINSGAHSHVFGGQPWNTFPLDRVKKATDAYVARQELVPDTRTCDSKLEDLILEHAQSQHGLKDVAVLACLHVLSRDAGSTLLLELRDECMAADNPRFLRCLLIARFANPLLVSDQEYRTAEALMHLLADLNFLDSVHHLFKIMEGLVNPAILSAPYISTVLETIRFKEVFQESLNGLQAQRRYMKIYNAVAWLRPLTGLPDDSTAKAVATTLIPHWEFWTAWKPDYLRLMNWEGGNFTDDQKRRLRRIFDLQGPDTTGWGRPTLMLSVPGCFEHVRVVNNNWRLLERLLHLLDIAPKIPGKNAVELFLFLLVENQNPIDDDLLNLTETILDTKSDSCIYAILQWLSELNKNSNNNRMAVLTTLLPALGSRQAVQRKLGGEIATDVIQSLYAAQSEYAEAHGVAENLAMTIQALARAVVDATWLRPTLDEFDPGFLQSLHHFPPEETLHNIFNSMQRSGAPTELIRRYLGIVFGGKDGDAAAMLSEIQKTIRFWADGVESDRANLALAVQKLGGIEDNVCEACLHHILAEDLVVVRDLLRILRTETSNSCVHLAGLLARRVRLRCKVHECWYGLLFSLLSPRGRDILAWSATKLPVKEWFQWQEDLKFLFPFGRERSVTHLGLEREHYSWWELLSSKYSSAVAELEKIKHTHGSFNLKWLWFQEVDYITELLDLLQRRERSSFQRFLISHIQKMPSEHVIKLVCTALWSVNHASPQGEMAFRSLYARHKQSVHGWWPRPATEALMISWRQSNEISDSDRDGLEAFSSLLKLGTAVDPSGLHFARQSLVSDHANLMAMAQDLEQMRSALQNDDTARTTAFLGELGVEDARPGADPNIPDKLSGVVESVGDNQWEICFPLSHLTAQEKLTAGIDETERLLLVRVSFLNLQPAFCVHFYPSDDGSDRNHELYSVSGDAPNGRVCRTRTTLFTYLLNRALYTFLSEGGRDLVSVHQMVSTVVKAPAANCIVCFRSMGCKLWRPTVCSDTCGEVFQRAPLEVRASHLINDPPTLDLLLSCVYASAADTSNLDLLPDCPIAKGSIRAVIDTFPRLIANTSAAQILALIRSTGDGAAASREQLLSWMCVQFRGCLVSAPPPGARVPSMPTAVQFLMLNAAPNREQAFSQYVALGGQTVAGGVTFHGTAVERMWRILTEGLRNMSGTQYVAHASPGEPGGVTLTDEARMSMDYGGSTRTSWQKSAFSNKTLLLVCELVGHSRQGVHVVAEEARIALRYVLLCPEVPGGFTPPQTAGEVNDVVTRTFTAIRTGELGRQVGNGSVYAVGGGGVRAGAGG